MIFFDPSFDFLWFVGLEQIWILPISGLRIMNGRFFDGLKVVFKKHYYNLHFGRVAFTNVMKSIPWLRHFALDVGNLVFGLHKSKLT